MQERRARGGLRLDSGCLNSGRDPLEGAEGFSELGLGVKPGAGVSHTEVTDSSVYTGAARNRTASGASAGTGNRSCGGRGGGPCPTKLHRDNPGNEGTVPEPASGGQTAPAQLTPTLSWPKHTRLRPSGVTKALLLKQRLPGAQDSLVTQPARTAQPATRMQPRGRSSCPGRTRGLWGGDVT